MNKTETPLQSSRKIMAKSSDSKLVCVSMVKLYMDLSGFIQAAGMRVPLHAVKSALLYSSLWCISR